MNLGALKFLLIIVITIAFGAGCIFKPSASRGVMSYRKHKVYLQGGGFYRVGKLPSGWKRLRVTSKAISFYNPEYDASITTDAFCGQSFADRPLDILSGELASVLAKRKTISVDRLTLDNRAAQRQYVSGEMDGIQVNMDIVVTKKNNCNFDFVAVMPADSPDEAREDFEVFFGGFQF